MRAYLSGQSGKHQRVAQILSLEPPVGPPVGPVFGSKKGPQVPG